VKRQIGYAGFAALQPQDLPDDIRDFVNVHALDDAHRLDLIVKTLMDPIEFLLGFRDQ
jgi:hypothetical protein